MVRSACLVVAVIAVLCQTSLALNDEDKAKIQAKLFEIGTECIKETPLTEDEINALRNKVVETENAKCFGACAFRKAGVFDDSGLLTPDTALELVRDVLSNPEDLDNLKNFFVKCSEINSETVKDACDRAKLAFECFKANSDEFGYNLDF